MQTTFPSNLQAIWQAIADNLAARVTKDTYQRWFKAISMTAADENDITLAVPNNIYQLWIESNYMPLLLESIGSVLGGARVIHFVIAPQESAPKSNGRHSGQDEAEEENLLDLGDEAEPMPAARHIKPGAVESRGRGRDASNGGGMNPRNTFATFVVGTNNQFAHAASLAVSQAPARTYNPLFIYGGVGLGKTHLMQAIGQSVVERAPASKVMYLSSEKFTNEFIDAIQNNSLVKFRKRYRQADLLLIDDIQFFSGKERSQEEFFHTFNTLFDGHKQIVLSSDRPPAEIANLEQRLVSRFEWGLTAELQPPDIETRLAILRKKAETLTIKLEAHVLEFLAQRIRTNVRRLEGALMRVASFASLNDTAIGTDAIEHLLKDILHEESRRTVTIDLIQRKVAEHFDVRVADMTSKRRPQNIAFPRQIAMFLARELTKASLAEIGEAFGGRDHGTVLHAHRLVRERMRNEEKIRQTVSFLESHLNR
ncbi:MAG TPA: chromosomal replication initiator protein DnaA [Chthoniobacteraceae bacterium]|jgi:chromosomal replication initiator protein|nr:chromosomal replication initiator protein DnaA [Chthoniobacteraceae bacterium]